MCSVVEANPAAVLSDMGGLLRVIAGWRGVDNTRMVHRLGGLLLNFKGGLEAQGEVGIQQWQAVMASLDPPRREMISTVYGV